VSMVIYGYLLKRAQGVQAWYYFLDLVNKIINPMWWSLRSYRSFTLLVSIWIQVKLLF